MLYANFGLFLSAIGLTEFQIKQILEDKNQRNYVILHKTRYDFIRPPGKGAYSRGRNLCLMVSKLQVRGVTGIIFGKVATFCIKKLSYETSLEPFSSRRF